MLRSTLHFCIQTKYHQTSMLQVNLPSCLSRTRRRKTREGRRRTTREGVVCVVYFVFVISAYFLQLYCFRTRRAPHREIRLRGITALTTPLVRADAGACNASPLAGGLTPLKIVVNLHISHGVGTAIAIDAKVSLYQRSSMWQGLYGLCVSVSLAKTWNQTYGLCHFRFLWAG